MKKLIYFTALVLVFAGCSDDSIDPSASFTKIYDSQRSDISYHPIDVVETTEGFIVLAGEDTDDSQFRELQVLQLDEAGNYLVEVGLPENLVAPMGEFISIDSVYYFFAMDPTLFTAQLVTMGNDPSNAEVIPINGIQYPLAANRTANGNLLLLSYSIQNTETILSEIDRDGQILQSSGYSIGPANDVEPYIWAHYFDPQRSSQPFFCGQVGADSYYFNGFYNFNLSLVFTNLGGNVSGTIQGQDVDNGGVRALLSLGSGNFSMFGYQFNTNFILPVQPIDTDNPSQSITEFLDLTMDFTEFKSRTPSIIRAMNLNGVNYSIVAAESQSRKVTLYFYDTASGALMGIHNIGHINPYTLGSIRVDAENNLLVIGTTLVSNRFERVFLNKISTKELNAILQ